MFSVLLVPAYRETHIVMIIRTSINDSRASVLVAYEITVKPHLSGHLRSQTDCPDNWISG